MNGLIIGLLTPVIVIGVIYGAAYIIGRLVDPDSGSTLSMRAERTYALLAICANIYWIRRYNGRLTQQILRGVIIMTMLCSLVWLWHYYSSLYS